MLRNMRSSVVVATLVVVGTLAGCATTRVEPLPKVGLPEHSGIVTVGSAELAPSFPTAAGEAVSTLAEAPLALLKAGPFIVAAVFMTPYIVAAAGQERIACLNSLVGEHTDAPSRIAAAVRADLSGDRLSEVLRAQLVARGDLTAEVFASDGASPIRHDAAIDRASRNGVDVLFELSDPEFAFRLKDRGCGLLAIAGLRVRVTRLRDGVVLADGRLTGRPSPVVLLKSGSDPVGQWLDDPQALSEVVESAFGQALEGLWLGRLGKTFHVATKASGTD